MPRRKTDQQHQEALAHEAHRGHPNYPHEEAGTCTFCAHLSLELVLPEREAIDTGQLTRAQRTALLLYPGDSAADRKARATILAAPQDGPDAPPLGKITNAAALAYLQDAGLEWVLAGEDQQPVRMVGVPPLREYTELVTTHISRAEAAHYASAESRRSRQLTPHFYASRAIECLERALPPAVTIEPDGIPVPVVADDVLRLVAGTIEGSLVVPADPSSQGYRFWAGAISDVQDQITERGTEQLLEDPRWHIPGMGEGRLLDRCSASQLARMVAEVEATEFAGEMPAYGEYRSLEEALEATMTAIYETVWEAVSKLLGAGELRVQYRDRPGADPVALLAVAG